jgi:hypothetical protein
MHFIVSWDIKSDKDRSCEINNAMKKGISGYSWLQPIPDFYIVEIYSGLDWESIREKLLRVAERFPGEVSFVMSPLYDCETDYFISHIPPDDDFYRQK